VRPRAGESVLRALPTDRRFGLGSLRTLNVF